MRYRFPRISTRAVGRAVLPFSLLWMLSCSDDPTSPPDDDGGPPPSGKVTKTITSAGGAISTKTQRDAMIALTFPAGAVGSSIDITLNPASSPTGSWINVSIEPANVVFLKDIDVVVTAPNDVTFDESQQLFAGTKSDPVLLPTTANVSARTLQTTIRGFGADAVDKVGFVPRTAALQVDKIANNIAAGSFDCQRHVEVADSALIEFIATEEYEAAIRAVLAAASCSQRENCPEADTWVTSTSQTACDALSTALLSAGDVVDNYRELRTNIALITYWAAMVRRINPACSSLGAVESTIANKITEFRTFFDDELQNLTNEDYTAFGNLKNEARDVNKLFTESLFLAEDAVATALQNDALYPTLADMRETAYDLCRQDGWHYPLSNLTSVAFYAETDVPGLPAPRNPAIDEPALYGPFTDDEIWDDIQFCATRTNVSTTVASGGTLAVEPAGGGSVPDSHVREITIRTPTRGKLVLEGSIGGFTCWNDIAADNTLIFEIGTRQVLTRTRTADEYLATPVEFDMKQLAQQAGIVITDASQVTMTVKRVRTSCDERLWGSAAYELLKINMDVEGPTIVITENMPPTVDPGDTVLLDVNVELRDQLDVPSVGAGVPVTITAFGATVLAPNGVTDANGIFQTHVVISTAAQAAAALRASSVPVFVNIIARIDGVTAQKTAESTVSGCAVDDAVVVRSQEQLDAFDGVCRIDNELVIDDNGSGTPIQDLSPLSNLTYVRYSLTIKNTALTDLTGLERISFGDSASLSIENNASLMNLDALASQGGSNMTSLTLVVIANNPSLTSITGIRNLMRLGGVTAFFVIISDNAVLGSLAGLDNLGVIGAALTVANNDALFSLGGLESLTSTDNLEVSGNASLTSIALLSGVAVSNSLIVSTNASLVNLAGLEAITDLDASCDVSSNAELNDINGLTNLTDVGNSFTITYNPKLCTLPPWVAAVSAPSKSLVGNGTDPSCSPQTN